MIPNINKYKLFVFDIDGTLLDKNSEVRISDQTYNLLQKLMVIIPITFATSRNIWNMKYAMRNFDPKFPVICNDGKHIVKGGALKRHIVSNSVSQSFISYLVEAYQDYFDFVLETEKEVIASSRRVKFMYNMFYDADIVVEERFYERKIEALTIVMVPIRKESNSVEIKPNSQFLSYSVRKRNLTDWYHWEKVGDSKARALSTLCKIYQINLSDVVVIGDSWNDISMFELAGYSVAPANAIEEIKMNADLCLDYSTTVFLENIIGTYSVRRCPHS